MFTLTSALWILGITLAALILITSAILYIASKLLKYARKHLSECNQLNADCRQGLSNAEELNRKARERLAEIEAYREDTWKKADAYLTEAKALRDSQLPILENPKSSE